MWEGREQTVGGKERGREGMVVNGATYSASLYPEISFTQTRGATASPM